MATPSQAGSEPFRSTRPAPLAILTLVAVCSGAPNALAHSADAPETSTSTAGGALSPPRLSHTPDIQYPPEAERAGLFGVVHLLLEVSVTGTVAKAELLEGPGEPLDGAALAAARRFRFEPALLDGVPIPVLVRYHYHFELPKTPDAHADHLEAHEGVLADTASASSSLAGVADSTYDVVVREKRPPRSATDFIIDLGMARAALPASASGAKLLEKAPGLYITQHSGEGKAHQIFLRGFDAQHGQDVELDVGGVPVNDVSNVHGQGYADLHFLIPEVARRVRVLEGAYDPRQGDFAVAGSIDFELGLTDRGLVSRFTAGNYGAQRAMLAWGPDDEPEETFVAAELARGDGFGPNRAYDRASVMAQAVLTLAPQTDLRLLASSYAGRFDSAGVVRLDDYEADRIDRFGTYDAHQGGASMRHQALAEVRWGEGLRSASLSTYMVLRELTIRQNFTGALVFPEGDGMEQTHDALTFGGEARFARRAIFSWLDAEAGVSFRHDEVEQGQLRLRALDRAAFLPEVDAHLSITDVGVYGDLQAKLGPTLRLSTGLRVEALAYRIHDRLWGLDERARREGQLQGLGERREASGFHLGPKATLDWRAASWARAFLSYGNGFRTPPGASLGQGERRPFTTVHSVELGARFELSPSFQATVAAFATHVPEDLAFDHASGRTLFTGATTRSGGVLVLSVTPFDWLSADLNATYTYAYNHDTEEPVPYSPTLVVRADVDGNVPLGNFLDEELALYWGLMANVLGPRPLPFDERGAPVFLVDANVGASWGRFALGVELANLFDAQWRDSEFVYASNFNPDGVASRVPARHFTAGRPFTAQATLTIGF